MNLQRLSAVVTTGFPLWIVLGCLWAWGQPLAWVWFRPWIEPGWGVIMLGMGLTLRVADFVAVARQPRLVLLGVAAQFIIMPLTGAGLAWAFQLEPGLAVGLILVACCPGGTASNVICYLAGANVPLSVLLTMCSTFLAIPLTPLLTGWLAGAYLPIDGWALFQSMLVVVLLPLLGGVAVNAAVGRLERPERVRRWIDVLGPILSALVVVLVVGCIVAMKQKEIASSAGVLFLSVFLLHGFGFGLGYVVAWVFKCPASICRTVSVEVGMQNSGLGASLATKHFAHLALAPVPAAISAVFHCLVGSVLAAWWRRRDEARALRD